MTIRPTLEAIRKGHDAPRALGLYGRSADVLVASFGGGVIAGFRLVIDPALPPDRLEVRNKGQLLTTIMLPKE